MPLCQIVPNSGIAVDLGIVTVGGNTLILKAGQSHRLQTVKGRGATVYHMPQAQSSTKPTFSCANAVFPKKIRYRQVYFHKRIVFFSGQTLQTNRLGRILVLGERVGTKFELPWLGAGVRHCWSC